MILGILNVSQFLVLLTKWCKQIQIQLKKCCKQFRIWKSSVERETTRIFKYFRRLSTDTDNSHCLDIVIKIEENEQIFLVHISNIVEYSIVWLISHDPVHLKRHFSNSLESHNLSPPSQLSAWISLSHLNVCALPFCNYEYWTIYWHLFLIATGWKWFNFTRQHTIYIKQKPAERDKNTWNALASLSATRIRSIVVSYVVAVSDGANSIE